MLQIITGKFYESEDRYHNDCQRQNKKARNWNIGLDMVTQKYMSSNPQRKLKVMAEQGYKCEVDPTHKTFQDKNGYTRRITISS